MSTSALTRRELAVQRSLPVRGRGLRIAIAVMVLSVAGVAASVHEVTRAAEAWVSTFVLGQWLGYDVYAWRDQIIFKLGPDRFDALALRITVECTSLVVLVPLLLFAAGVLVVTRVNIARWLLSVVVAIAIVFAVNIVRITTIAYSLREFGREGYGWTHTVVGTVIIAIGTVIAVIVMLAIQNLRGARRRRRGGEVPACTC